MPAGRPTVLTKAVQTQIAELFWLAFTDEQVALVTGVSVRTIERARKGQFCRAIKIAELKREAIYRKKIWEAKGFWQGAAWFLERKYPEQFARPEIQLSFQQNYNIGALQINISAGEAKQIEASAKPVRERVKEMFAKYKPMTPQLGNDNGEELQKGTE
jgi:hypothetical protein